ncbi:MAG: hypothetical protein GPJ15_09730 [Microcystis aeruginosa G11-06]|nr:hypothetical protein [Microcystis aeruginosa LE13-04]NCS20261.1 hypothetical protein [Microcystis aeruginosa G11-06]
MFSYLKGFLVGHASKLILLLLVGVPVVTTVSVIISNQIAKKEPIDLQPEEVVRRLQEDYPGWQDKLFACPCTEDEIIQQRKINAKSYPLTPSNAAERQLEMSYHPGAKGFYRSAAPDEYRPEGRNDLYPLRPGQQCTYDENGRLITHGPAAGTPDAYGSNATDSYFFTSIGKGKVSGLHTTWDVDTYKKLGWREYHKIWKPNNGNSCLFNPSPENVRSLDKQIAKADFGIPRLLYKGVVTRQGVSFYLEKWIDSIRVFKRDNLEGSPRTIYEIQKRLLRKEQGQQEYRERRKVWIQCSTQNPWMVYSNPLDDTDKSQDSDMHLQYLGPGTFVSMVAIPEYDLYWGICHDSWGISYDFYYSPDVSKQYGYSPNLRDSYRVISEAEFLEALYGDRSL